MRTQPLILLLALAFSLPAAAQLTPLGPEFPVNAAPLHEHDGAAVALSSGGTTLAVWTVPVSFFYNEVWARAFDADGQPLGPGGRIDTGNFLKLGASVIALPDGRFAVAWTNSALVPGGPRNGHVKIAPDGLDIVSLRLVGPAGLPNGSEIRVDASGESSGTLRLASSAGGFVVAWSEHAPLLGEERAVARRFNVSGAPLGNEFLLDSSTTCTMTILSVAGLADGGLSAFWHSGDATQTGCPGTRARRFAATGQPAVPIFAIAGADLFAVRPDGSYLAVRNKLPPPSLPVASGYDVYVQLYDQNGVPLDDESSLTSPAPGDQKATGAVAGRNGGFLVVWSNDAAANDDLVDADVTAQLLDAAGHPVGPQTRVNAQMVGDQSAPRAATDGQGGWVVSWVSEAVGQDGGDLFARRFTAAAPCLSALCLNGARFGVDVTWRDPRSGRTGTGHGVPLAGDTGAFWFFSAENVELFVKVLDGSLVNQHFWVFFGSLSDVEFTLTVTDTEAGTHKSYHNPPYTLASQADTLAFPVSAALAGTAETAAPADVADGTGLSLNGDRFRVNIAWTDPRTGNTGSGQAVPLSGDSGYFWFFSAGNVETVVKVLDGRPVNGHFWVFYASLSDVEFTLDVTDSVTNNSAHPDTQK
jgi:hypothetical protein